MGHADGIDEAVPIRVARLPRTTDRNPYQAMLYDHLADEGVELVGEGTLSEEWLVQHRDLVDVLHLHWRLDRLLPDEVRVDGVGVIAERLRLARAFGYLVVWTVHEAGRLFGSTGDLEQQIATEIASEVDLVLAHDEATAAMVRARLGPGVVVAVTGLGHYAGVYPAGPPRGEARQACGLAPTTPTLLAFGHLRPDKDLDLLCAGLASAPDLDVQVLVAGEVDEPGVAERLRAAARVDPRLRLRLTRLDDREVATVHAAADAVVLARSVDWTPSSLVLALSLGVPVVAADLATCREHGGPGGWWFAPGDPSSLADVLGQVVHGPERERVRRGAAGQAHVMRSSPRGVARRTAEAMAALVDGRRLDARRPPRSVPLSA